MHRWPQTLLLSAIAILCGSVSAGCAADPLFMECPLSKSIVETCAADSDNILYTCVVGEHPSCLESICVSWLGAQAVCSQACAQGVDCPAGSVCKSHLALSFCVLDEHLQETVEIQPPATGE